MPLLLRSLSGADKKAIAYVDKPDLMNTEAEKEERGGEEEWGTEGKLEIRRVKREKELSGREEIREKRWTGALVTADASLDLCEREGALQRDGGEREGEKVVWNDLEHNTSPDYRQDYVCLQSFALCGGTGDCSGWILPTVWNGYEF